VITEIMSRINNLYLRICFNFVFTSYPFIFLDVFFRFPLLVAVTMKIIRLIKMCLNVIYSTVRIGKRLSDNFPMQNQGAALSPLLFNF
jgi:hypothetical protein